MRHLAHSLTWYLLLVPLAGADDSSTTNEGRHRVDLSFTAHDAKEADLQTVLPGYTYTLANQLRLGITASYTFISPADQGREFGIQSNSGPGDVDLNLQYSPSSQLTSSPWVPNTLGFTLGLTAPVGDVDKGLGGDQWAYRIGLGWGYNAWSNLYLVPSVNYERSFFEGSDALELEYFGAGVGLYWVTTGGVFIGYTPYLGYDGVFNDWADDHSIVIGKMWPSGLGLSLEYGQADRIDKAAIRDDYTAMINFYYQFGQPP